jgi:hypothetical protein
MTMGENLDIGGKYESKGIKLKFEHTSRGSKLINLIDAFECALHMFACMAQAFKLKFHACVVYASCRYE